MKILWGKMTNQQKYEDKSKFMWAKGLRLARVLNMWRKRVDILHKNGHSQI